MLWFVPMILQKVARSGSPLQDAAVIQAVRKKVGYHIKIRADANRNWTYEEAIQFGSLVKDCDLQYIEVLPLVKIVFKTFIWMDSTF